MRSCSRSSSDGSGASVRSCADHAAAALCAGCEEGCDPERCLDCPECATAAEDGERGPSCGRGSSAWPTSAGRAGPTSRSSSSPSPASRTTGCARRRGALLFDAIYPPVSAVLGPSSPTTFLLVETLQFAWSGGLPRGLRAVALVTRALGPGPTPLARRAGRPLRGDPAPDRRRLPHRPLPDAGAPGRRLAALAARRPAHGPRATARRHPRRRASGT